MVQLAALRPGHETHAGDAGLLRGSRGEDAVDRESTEDLQLLVHGESLSGAAASPGASSTGAASAAFRVVCRSSSGCTRDETLPAGVRIGAGGGRAAPDE